MPVANVEHRSTLPLRSAPCLCATGTRRPSRQARLAKPLANLCLLSFRKKVGAPDKKDRFCACAKWLFFEEPRAFSGIPLLAMVFFTALERQLHVQCILIQKANGFLWASGYYLPFPPPRRKQAIALSSARRKRHKEAAKEPSWFLCKPPRRATSLFSCVNKTFCINGNFGCNIY